MRSSVDVSAPRTPRAAIGRTLLLCMLLLTAACDSEDSETAFLTQERADAAAAFDAAVRKQDWQQAVTTADAIAAKYPDSEETKRIASELPAIRERAEAARIEGLWSYDEFSMSGGVQRTAAIYAKDTVDVDGTGPTAVRLIFRDHPSWGRSSYLVLQTGDFDCYGGCKVQVKIDDKPAKAMAGLAAENRRGHRDVHRRRTRVVGDDQERERDDHRISRQGHGQTHSGVRSGGLGSRQTAEVELTACAAG